MLFSPTGRTIAATVAIAAFIDNGVAAGSANATVSPVSDALASSVATNGTSGGTSTSTATSTASSSAPSNSGDNPLIPTTISAKCQTFLAYLNSDDTLAACTAPLVSAVALFAPSTSTSTPTVSDADVNSGLAALCAVTPCSDSLIRSALTGFNGNCSQELQDKDAAVLGSYDVLYIVNPFTKATCTKDVDGGYCLLDIIDGSVPSASSSNASAVSTEAATTLNRTSSVSTSSDIASANSTSTSSASVSSASSNGSLAAFVVHDTAFNIQAYAQSALNPSNLFYSVSEAAVSVTRKLLRRSKHSSSKSHTSTSTISANSLATVTNSTSNSTSSDDSTDSGIVGLLPNATTFRLTSLPFLFLSPNMSSNVLCTTCTKAILSSYVSWESRMPYALGLANSPILGGQSELWNGIGDICGTGFLQAVTQQAGVGSVGAASGLGFFASKAACGTVALGAVLLAIVMQ